MTQGARPQGSSDEQSARLRVQAMFNQIAPRYDLLNRILSANVAQRWWRRTARTFHQTLADPNAVIVDLCCGTGSLTLELERLRPAHAAPLLAMDFAHSMLLRGAQRFRATAVEADAMKLPLADNSVHLVTTAFGFRNLPNYDVALREMHRVLAPGGTFAILEANEPRGLLGKLYRAYFHGVVPRIGSLFSSRAAYAYLPESVARFPAPEELLARIRSAGFAHAEWTAYSFGIAGLYSCTK